MQYIRKTSYVLGPILALLIVPPVAQAQRIRPQPPVLGTPAVVTNTAMPPPPAANVPLAPGSTAALGVPSQGFDPYSSATATGGGVVPLSSPSAYGSSWSGGGGAYPQTNPCAPACPPACPPPMPGSPYPSQTPGALCPGAWPTGVVAPTWPSMAGYQRLFTETGFDVEWLYGDEGRELDMLSVGVHTTANWMKFPFDRQPLRITPGFVFRFLDGPDSQAAQPVVPAQLYDAYLDFAWRPELPQAPMISGDLSVRMGVYSDFKTVSTDSVRLTGTGLAVVRLSDTFAVKMGATYLDRADIKLLPAGGILWTPNERTEFDIYFPAPKLKQDLITLGNADVAWYVGGEYGGGSWTIEEPVYPPFSPGGSERIDINDLRIFGGWEWVYPSGLFGFLEVGYVFDRQIVAVQRPGNSLRLRDTIMVRGGVTY